MIMHPLESSNMAWNSQPQGLTAAQQQAGTQINPINMQGVVAAILEHQQMQQRQQQIQQQQIQQGLSQYAQQYEQQQNDDLANRAIYQAKYPGDPYSGQPGYDDRVLDYGGTQGLKIQEIQSQLQYKKALADQAAAHAEHWQNNATASGGSDTGIPQPNIFTDSQSGQRYIMGKNGVPHLIKSPINPEDDFLNKPTKFGATGQEIYDAAVAGHVKAADDKPFSNNQQVQVTLPDGRTIMARRSDLAPYVNRGMSLYQSQLNPPPGATSSSTTSTRPGAGPTTDAISYLQQHPELASQFDSKYGKGMAATYLGQ